jgi:hypothetical protein
MQNNVPVGRASDFINTIGVNTHVGWFGTVNANVPLEEQELAYLGIKYTRDYYPDPPTVSEYQALAAAGIKFDLIVDPTGTNINASLPTDLQYLDTFEASSPGSIISIEGPNELNTGVIYYNGGESSNPSVAASIMQAISTAVKSDPNLVGIPLINLSISNGVPTWQNYLAGLGNLSSFVDYANWHVYFDNGQQPAQAVTSMYQDALASAPGKPVIYTESGYFTAYDYPSNQGVDYLTQAKNTLNLLADAFKTGVVRTYLYELMDHGRRNRKACRDRNSQHGIDPFGYCGQCTDLHDGDVALHDHQPSLDRELHVA